MVERWPLVLLISVLPGLTCVTLPRYNVYFMGKVYGLRYPVYPFHSPRSYDSLCLALPNTLTFVRALLAMKTEGGGNGF
jgi:hypothetical protein